ncbi:MAG: Lrp/AsnC family transcriptional regulator [Chloroflexi bacterium]|nr:Lrp/AsnC family transcriptional regulator [Chloroflexota bacterium]MBI3177031.1 Lrp/AsnC family transcriptional regulator [Chloroflexota bacterium]
MPTQVDETDRKILALLQHDARMTNAAIAAEVGLTAPSVFERIRKLEQRGVIQNYAAAVDPAALGKTLTAFIRLTVAYDDKHAAGVEAMRRDPDVLECYHVAGEDCFILKTKVSDPGELERLTNRIRSQMTVLRTVTMIALSAVKEGGPINVNSPTPAAPATPPRSRKK